jgi:hypothetical protein
MKIANKYTILFMLCLALLAVTNIHCLIQPITPPTTPQSPELPPQDTTPPETTITKASDKTIDYNEITFQWTGSDNITSTANLTYSYYLQGYDTDYSPFNTDTTKTYTDLPDGTYIFYVKSRDEASNIDPTPASVTFTIAMPQPEEEPGATVPAVSTLLIVPGSDVSHIAVAYDNTVYALDSLHAKLYKSEHGGIDWTDISRGLSAAAPWTGLAIAPDDPEIVAVVTNAGTEVYLSTNGGANFTATGLTGKLGGGERIRCLAISSGYGRRDISVGTSTGSGNGRVLTNVSNGYPSSWQDMSTGAAGWSNADIFSLEYSPGFDIDGTLLAIAATAPPTDDTYLYIGTRDIGGNTITWNSFAGYPVEICQSGQDTPGTPLTYADLALPADYSGSRPSHRHVYACWSDMGGNPDDDVYRLDNAVCYRLMVRDIICSLAHYGMFSQGKLLAGAAIASATDISAGPQVYCTFNPQSAYPIWQSSQKPPTGPGQARVAWSPDGKAAYCGTSSAFGGSHDQSAFSISRNDGFTWNQIGLIDL